MYCLFLFSPNTGGEFHEEHEFAHLTYNISEYQ